MTTDSEFTIRRALPEDTGKIAEFNANMALETEGIELVPEVILAGARALQENAGLGFYLVAESDKKIIGSLMVTTEWSDWRNGQFWWIQSVYVIPDFRRKGVYSGLYAKVKELADENPNVCGFRLYVEKNNTNAQSTYQRLGMEETEYLMYEELQPGTVFHR